MTALIDTGTIAEMLGVSRPYVTNRLTKLPDFPKPRIDLSQRLRRWAEADVRAYLERRHKRDAMSSADSR